MIIISKSFTDKMLLKNLVILLILCFLAEEKSIDKVVNSDFSALKIR